MKLIAPTDPLSHSADLTTENIERLRELFPQAVTEDGAGKRIDFDVLRELLGGELDMGDEKYGLNWHGKRAARRLALTPSTGTLRPAPEESVDWDTTENLMIEGDNLEVLKLLQKSYAGKVKMIYIDPPYNTGKDFVYKDDFRDSIGNYQRITGQRDAEGAKLTTNAESSGRFHTDWLNMMYPRLTLARNLMRDDGLIFISIDEGELARTQAMCDQIFGPENHIETLIWKKSYGGGAKEYFIVRQHEYCLLYARHAQALAEFWLPPDEEAEERYYTQEDEKLATRGPYRIKPLEATKSMDVRENLRYPIPAPDGTDILPKRQWWWAKERTLKALSDKGLVFIKSASGWTVSYKQYLRDEEGKKRGAKPFSILDKFYTQQGTADLRALFDDEVVLQFPKPVAFIRHLLHFGATEDCLVLDFFAGSGTTAQAVLEANSASLSRLRFILVQMPESIPIEQVEGSTVLSKLAVSSASLTIADLTKERIRRASTKIKAENPIFHGDLGFRVFKLDNTSIRPWDPSLPVTEQRLLGEVDNILPGRTEQDLLYELLLKRGLELTVPIVERTLAGKQVFAVSTGDLIACLAPHIESADVEALAEGIVTWHKELAPPPAVDPNAPLEKPAKFDPPLVVFRDTAFADDVAKSNLTEILKQHSLTDVRSL